MNITIRNAVLTDNQKIRPLQKQIAALHYEGRPDLFKTETRYYTNMNFRKKLKDPRQFIYIAVSGSGDILGYAFAKIIRYRKHSAYRDFDTFYIDDICVDESIRGQGIGRMLFEKCKEQAWLSNCQNIDLDVYTFNQSAIAFYEHCGMTEQKRRMELIL